MRGIAIYTAPEDVDELAGNSRKLRAIPTFAFCLHEQTVFDQLPYLFHAIHCISIPTQLQTVRIDSATGTSPPGGYRRERSCVSPVHRSENPTLQCSKLFTRVFDCLQRGESARIWFITAVEHGTAMAVDCFIWRRTDPATVDICGNFILLERVAQNGYAPSSRSYTSSRRNRWR